MMRKQLPQISPFILISLLLTLSACSSLTTAAQPSGQTSTQPAAKILPPATAGIKIDACALLTKTDAEQILGKPVDDPTHPVSGNEIFNVDSCEYKITGGTALDNAALIVTVPVNGDLATAQTAFNTGKQQVQAVYNVSPVDIPGLGDTAYWITGAGNNLSILKGKVSVTLSASTQTGDMPSQTLIDLAKAVLDRLP